ncbi:MAG: AAA family ATPase, partial [Chloroflexi bacterium]
MSPTERSREAMDDLDLLLAALPDEVVTAVHALPDQEELIEVVLDLGRPPEARFPEGEVTLLEREITEADIAHVVENIGSFGDDNRAGIERTLHRISAIRNRTGKVVGLTCRIGKAVFGTIEIIQDFVETGKSILIMGRPGIGKTTMLREAARVLADDLGKRVVVVDTSNEIAGDGDIPHPAIGKARRMQVRTPSMQHEVMIEAVENHMPQVIVIDEIGTELEAAAARTIAERGVMLIGTAHGNTLDNLMLNPTLSDLIGGIQSVTLGDEEARRRRTQKSVLERKAPPTFDVVIEIQDRDRVTVHPDVADTVDAMLRGDPIAPELRWRDEEGIHRSQSRPRPSPREQLGTERFAGLVGAGQPWRVEPGWRGDSAYRTGGHGAGPGYREADRGGFRPGYRPGASGGWRQARAGASREGSARTGPAALGGEPGTAGTSGGAVDGPDDEGPPGAQFDTGPGLGLRGSGGLTVRPDERPFVAGDIADRGPLERLSPGAAA